MAAARRRPIERQIQTYEEEWKREHDDAMRCWDFQALLALGVAIYGAIEHVYTSWRTNVARGEDEYVNEDEQELKDLFTRWVKFCTEHAEGMISHFEGQFGNVDSAAEFRETCARAQQVLSEWKPPVLQGAPGLRSFTLTEQDVARLGEFTKQGGPRLTRRPRPL